VPPESNEETSEDALELPDPLLVPDDNKDATLLPEPLEVAVVGLVAVDAPKSWFK
jgi:hypothetical protein